MEDKNWSLRPVRSRRLIWVLFLQTEKKHGDHHFKKEKQRQPSTEWTKGIVGDSGNQARVRQLYVNAFLKSRPTAVCERFLKQYMAIYYLFVRNNFENSLLRGKYGVQDLQGNDGRGSVWEKDEGGWWGRYEEISETTRCTRTIAFKNISHWLGSNLHNKNIGLQNKQQHRKCSQITFPDWNIRNALYSLKHSTKEKC